MNRKVLLFAMLCLVLSLLITYAVAGPGKPAVNPGLNTPKINIRPNVYGQKLDAANIQLTQITQQVMSKQELLEKRASLAQTIEELKAEMVNIDNLLGTLD